MKKKYNGSKYHSAEEALYAQRAQNKAWMNKKRLNFVQRKDTTGWHWVPKKNELKELIDKKLAEAQKK